MKEAEEAFPPRAKERKAEAQRREGITLFGISGPAPTQCPALR